MMYDPTMNHIVHEPEQAQIARLQTMNLSALGTYGGGPNPVAVDYFFHELSAMLDRRKFRNLFLRLTGRDPRTEALRRELEARLGVELPLDAASLKALKDEVSRYKWIEAERAGHDIWVSRNPRDPEGTALQEWFRLHFGAWYLANVRHG